MQNVSLQKTALFLFILIAGGFLLIIGKQFLIPMVLAALFSFLIFPLTARLEKRGLPRILSNLLMLVVVIAVVVGGTIGLSFLIKNFVNEVPSMSENITANIDKTQVFVEKHLNISIERQQTWFNENVNLGLISNGDLLSVFSTTTATFVTVSLMFIYTFFFLYYRDKFREFLFRLTPWSKHETFHTVTGQITSIIPRYLLGLVLVAIVLSIINSAGFAIIGLNNPIFFGVLTALLNVIPYLGPIVGFGVVFLFALATQDVSTAAWVGVMFMTIQFFENNILTPNITAGQVKLNPFVAIVSVVLGGIIWGIIGTIIAIPVLGMIKTVCDNIPRLQPLGYLLGTTGTEEYAVNWTNVKNRFKNLFNMNSAK